MKNEEFFVDVSEILRFALNDRKEVFMALRIVTLDELKMQMREDFDGEDHVIELYGEAAENAVIKATRRTYEELVEMAEAEGNDFPSMLKVAILMLAAHLHRNREPVAAVAQNVVPYTLDMYIKPYVKLSDREL